MRASQKWIWSRYNFAVHVDERALIYNALSGALFEVSPELYVHVASSITAEPDTVPTLPDDELAALAGGRFVLDRDANELEYLKLRHMRAVFANTLHLIILPTLECNLSCWYCTQNHPPGRMNARTRQAIVRLAARRLEQDVGRVHLDWFGGEPLLCFDDVFAISRDIKTRCADRNRGFDNSITTNASLITDEMIGGFDEIDLRTFQITLDGSQRTHDETKKLKSGRGTYDRIIANIEALCERLAGVCITLRVNYSDALLPGLQDSLIGCLSKTAKQRCHLSFQRIWQTVSGETGCADCIQDQFASFTAAGYATPTDAFRPLIGTKCYVDRFNEVVVNWDGTIHKCTARNFSQPSGELDDKGDITWLPTEVLRYTRFPYENEVCLNCRVLPLCMGPCSQKFMDRGFRFTTDMCPLISGATPELFVANLVRLGVPVAK
jgi:uncharacterized protein